MFTLRRGHGLRAGAADHVGRARRRRDQPRQHAHPGAQLPARRDAGRPGAGRDGHRRADGRAPPRSIAGVDGHARSCPRCATPASTPSTVDVVAVSHLHFDHAGGLLTADGERAFPRARIVAQADEWEFALGYEPAAAGAATSRTSCAWSSRGRGAAQPMATRRSCRACRSCAPAATRAATRRSSSAARPDGRLLRRPVHAAVERQPALGAVVRRLPADVGRGQGVALPPGGPRRAGRSCCRTSRASRSAASIADRDRFRFEPRSSSGAASSGST